MRRLPIQPMPGYRRDQQTDDADPQRVGHDAVDQFGDRFGDVRPAAVRDLIFQLGQQLLVVLQHDAADREADHQDRHQGQEREVRHRPGELAAQPVAVPGDRRDQVFDALLRRDALAPQHQPADRGSASRPAAGPSCPRHRCAALPVLESAMGPPVSGARCMSGIRALRPGRTAFRSPAPVTQASRTRSTAEQADLVVHRGDRRVGDLPGPDRSGRQHPVQFPGIGEVNRDLRLQRRDERDERLGEIALQVAVALALVLASPASGSACR